jgi:ABC-type phosphate transport system auxiliary subunit
MSESGLERLRQKVRKKEVERKVDAFRKEHIDKERA